MVFLKWLRKRPDGAGAPTGGRRPHAPAATGRYDAFGRSVVDPQPVEPHWPDDDPRWDELDLQEQIEHERRVRAATAKDRDLGLLVAGWICAVSVLFAPVGVAIGIVLLVRQRVGQGLAILFLSLLTPVIVFLSLMWVSGSPAP